MVSERKTEKVVHLVRCPIRAFTVTQPELLSGRKDFGLLLKQFENGGIHKKANRCPASDAFRFLNVGGNAVICNGGGAQALSTGDYKVFSITAWNP